MKCQTAYVWLLSSKTTASLPDEVQRHLSHCRRCQRCQQRLLWLDAELKPPPPSAADLEVKARLFRQLTQLPRQSAAAPPSPRAPRGRGGWRVLVGATAAAVLLGTSLGWLLGRRGDTREGEPHGVLSSASPAAEGPRAGDVLVLAVNHDLSLAETWTPAAQVRTLGELAADLRREALRLARQGPLEDLPLVAILYQTVLRRGLIGRARLLPADQRPAVLAPLAQQLQESAVEVTRIAEGTLPAVAEHFQAMALAAREASDALLNPPKAPLPAEETRTAGVRGPLLETVVLEALRLAEEKDPLRRADSCSTIAEQLVQKVLLVSAREEVEPASTLGKCLGELVDRGVADNLDRIEMDNMDKDGVAELERVRQRVATASAALQSNWQRAPPQARRGLERAMEASGGGLERAAQAGKGKGKLKPKDKHGHPPKGKPFLPPGLDKKRNKDDAAGKKFPGG